MAPISPRSGWLQVRFSERNLKQYPSKKRPAGMIILKGLGEIPRVHSVDVSEIWPSPFASTGLYTAFCENAEFQASRGHLGIFWVQKS